MAYGCTGISTGVDMTYRGRAAMTGNPQSIAFEKAYLEFLAEQMQTQPHLIRGLSSLERAEPLVEGVEVDPEEDLGGDVSFD
jgi:hypothetical protein